MVFLHFDLLDLCYEFGAQYVLDDIFYIYICVYLFYNKNAVQCRQFAQRSRVRKLQYIAELERNVQALQASIVCGL